MELLDEKYWTNRYDQESTGWDIGYVSTPLKAYFDQLENRDLKILIPGAGNAYEAECLHGLGFRNVTVVDLSSRPLQNLKARCPEFPDENLVGGDFFDLDDKYDLIVEQTFFCALDPTQRPAYVEKAKSLLLPGGKIVGLLFNIPLFDDHPPFGGNEEEYSALFSPYFHIEIMEEAHNSIKPRQGNELFIKLRPRLEA